jgi:hypothetical protein
MPSIKDQSTCEAIAREYCSNGRCKAQALKEVGYKETYYNSGIGLKTVYDNIRVKEAIRAIDEAGAVRSERTVQSIDDMYQQAYTLASTSNQPSAMVSACTGIARLYGMDKDTQASPDQPLPMTESQLLEAHRAANVALASQPVAGPSVDKQQEQA